MKAFKNLLSTIYIIGIDSYMRTRDTITALPGKILGKDNGIRGDIHNTQYINATSLTGLTVPSMTKDDKEWAKQFRNAPTHAIGKALCEAIEKNQNERALYLLNRPYKMGYSVLSGPKHRGFHGNLDLTYALHSAALADNAAAAYLLLRFAEKKPSFHIAHDGKVTDKIREQETRYILFKGLGYAALHGAENVANLCIDSLGEIGGALTDGANDMEDPEKGTIDAVCDLIRLEKTSILERMFGCGTPKNIFEQGLMQSFGPSEEFRPQRLVTKENRNVFLAWAAQHDLFDGAFLEEIHQMELQEAENIAAAKANDSYYIPVRKHAGYFGDADTEPEVEVTYQRIDEEKVEATLLTQTNGSAPLNVVFNFVSGRATTGKSADISLDDFAAQSPIHKDILHVARIDWEDHKTLRRLPNPPRKRAKIVKFGQ